MTMDDSASSHVESLLADGHWLRTLASQLVRDRDLADDLVQRAYLALLSREFPEQVRLRAYITTTLRNMVRWDARSRTTRRASEREASLGRMAVEAADHSLRQVEEQAALSRAIKDLREPYRSAILARYVEGLAPREIAARSSMPLKTVKAQLYRGLELLRDRLDHDHEGDRRAWVIALLPALAHEKPLVPFAGRQMIRWNTALACALLIAILASALWTLSGPTFVITGAMPATPDFSVSDVETASKTVAQDSNAHELARIESAMPATTFVEVQVRSSGTSEPQANATVRWWPIPQGTPLGAVDSWFRDCELEERTDAGSQVFNTDERGLVWVPRNAHGMVLTAVNGTLWGWDRSDGVNENRIDLSLRRDFDVPIEVFDEHRQAIPEAIVRLGCLGYCSGTYLEAKTGDDGIGLLRHAGYVKNNPIDVEEAAAAAGVSVLGVHGHGLENEWTAFALSSEEPPAVPLEFVITEPAGLLDIWVVSQQGIPVEHSHDIDIQFLEESGRAAECAVLRVQHGHAVLPVALGRYIEVNDSDPNPGPRFAGERREVRVTCHNPTQSPIRYTGRAIDQNGAPIGNTSIGFSKNNWPSVTVVSDIRGTFEFFWMPSCNSTSTSVTMYATQFDAAGNPTADGEKSATVVRSQVALGDVILVPRIAPIMLAGTVGDYDGRPVAHAEVWIALRDELLRSHSDASGRFELRTVESERDSNELMVRAVDGRSSSGWVNARIGQTSVKLECDSRGTIEGSVLFDPAQPSQPLLIRWERIDTPTPDWVRSYAEPESSILETHGSFALQGIGLGDYSISIVEYVPSSGGNDFKVLHTLDVTRLTVEAPMARVGPIDLRQKFHTVRVIDEFGSPIPYANVSVWFQGGNTYEYEALSDKCGAVRVFAAAEGRRVSACAKGYACEEMLCNGAEICVVLRQAPSLNFTWIGDAPVLPDGASLYIRVQRRDGRLDAQTIPAETRQYVEEAACAQFLGMAYIELFVKTERDAPDEESTVSSPIADSGRLIRIESCPAQTIAIAVPSLAALDAAISASRPRGDR